MSKPIAEFMPLNIAVLCVSDSRTLQQDTSGQYLADSLLAAGHHLADRRLITDDIYQIRAVMSSWIADPNIHAVMTTGGTGFFIRDSSQKPLACYLISLLTALVRCFAYSQKMRSACLRFSRVRLLVWLTVPGYFVYRVRQVLVRLAGIIS